MEGFRSSNSPWKTNFVTEKFIIQGFNGNFVYFSETKRKREAGKGKGYESKFNQNLFSVGINQALEDFLQLPFLKVTKTQMHKTLRKL